MKNISKFASQQTTEVVKLINSGMTTSILGIPGAGITLFLKNLSTQPLGHVIYLDVFSLSNINANEFYKDLLIKLGGKLNPKDNTEELVTKCKYQLEKLIVSNEKIVICIPGFDQLQAEFSTSFFQYLRSLRSIDQSKIVFVFGICRRIDTILPQNLINADLNLFTSVYYLKPYSKPDIEYLLAKYGPNSDLSDDELENIISISGGHFQFLQLLMSSERLNNPTQDPFIKLAFNNIFNHLSTPQKSIIRKLAISGTYTKHDTYLTNVGIIKKVNNEFQLFSPLFADCIRKFSAPKLPVKERRLLAILKKHEGRLVSKRDLFDYIWRNQEIGTEWGLNALIYRLRKHPAFTILGYSIENHKKIGYILSKNA